MEKSLFKINAEGINNSNLQQDNNENISSSIEETAITSKKESINVETIVDDTSLNFAVSSDTEKVDVIQQEATDNTSTDKAETTNSEKKMEEDSIHVIFGDKLIEVLNLKFFNNNLYAFSDGKYNIVTDKFLRSCILKYIYKNANLNLRKNIIAYVNDILYDEDAIFEINKDYINFKNGLYDLKNKQFIEHTPKVFSINQVHVNYISDFKANNEVVNNYLDEITNYVPERKQALLQTMGYSLTTRNNIQKFFIWYGPSASNGKSTLAKIIVRIIGPENVSHKDMQTLSRQFGANGIQDKLLNIVSELPINKVKDTAVLKNTISGDAFETDVKFAGGTDITSYVKHIFTANTLPQVADNTDGFYRKVNILLFDNKFDVKTSTFDVDEFMSQENLDYLANLALREYLKMISSNNLEFANQEESDKLLQDYRKENDTVVSFLTDADTVLTIYNCDVVRASMFNLYKSYCSRNKFIPLGQHAFFRALRENYGFAEKPINNGTQIAFFREKPIFDNLETNNR